MMTDDDKGRVASAQIGCPGMRLRQGPQKGAVGLGLAVADDDLSLDTAPAQFERSLDRQNRVVNLIGQNS